MEIKNQIVEEYNIMYKNFEDKVEDKIFFPFYYTIFSSLVIPIIILIILLTYNLNLIILQSLFILIIIIFIFSIPRFFIYKNFINSMNYKIRIFNEFLILPKKRLELRRPGAINNTANDCNYSVLFYEDIINFQQNNNSIIIKLNNKIKYGTEFMERINFIKKIKTENQTLELPKYQAISIFMKEYTIYNLSHEEIEKINRLLTKNLESKIKIFNK